MLTHAISWPEFLALTQTWERRPTLIYRGQARASWDLSPSLLRLVGRPTLATYLTDLVPAVHDVIAASLDSPLELSRPAELARFLSILQRSAFPTPLLDWTRSPLVAAFFAFSDRHAGEAERVAIWQLDVGVPEFPQTPLEVLSPHPADHPALVAQGGLHLRFTAERTLEDIASHADATFGELLVRFDLPAAEGPQALAELAALGIDAATLFPGGDAVCQRIEQDLAYERRQRFPH